jgi:hypothetical protein
VPGRATPAPTAWSSLGAGSMPSDAAKGAPGPLPLPPPAEPWTAPVPAAGSTEPARPPWMQPPAPAPPVDSPPGRRPSALAGPAAPRPLDLSRAGETAAQWPAVPVIPSAGGLGSPQPNGLREPDPFAPAPAPPAKTPPAKTPALVGAPQDTVDVDIQFTEQHNLPQPAAAAPTKVAERAKVPDPATAHEPTLMAQLAKAAGVRLGHVWGVVVVSALVALVAFGLIVRSILADRPAAEIAVQAEGTAPAGPSPLTRPAAPAPAGPPSEARRPVELAAAPPPGVGKPTEQGLPQPRAAETVKAPVPAQPAARAAETVPAERKKAKVAVPAPPAPPVVVKAAPVKAPPPPPVEKAARPGPGVVAVAAPAPLAPAPAVAPAPAPAPDPAPAQAPPAAPAAGRTLAPAAVQGAIARGKPGFDKCVETALTAPGGDALAGRRIALLVAVGNAGTVEASEVEDPDVEGSPLGACLRRAAGRLVFPPFDGEVVGVRVPLQVGAARPGR